MRNSIIVFLCLALPGTLAAQTHDIVRSTVRARDIIARAVDSMGGFPALQSLGVVYREMEGIRTDEGQGPRPVARGTSEPAPVNRPRLSVWTDAMGQRFVQVLRDTILGGQPIHWWYAYGASEGFFADAVFRTMSRRSAAQLARSIPGALRNFAEGVMVSLVGRRSSARWVGTAASAGRRYDVVTFADGDGSQVAVWFDAASGLPERTESFGGSPVTGEGPRERRFLEWRQVGNARLPAVYEDHVNGVLLQRLRETIVRPGSVIPDSMTAAPPWPAPFTSGPLTARELSSGVAAITGSYNSLVVAFDTFSVVVELGSSPQYAEGVLREARRLFPDRPVRYAVATHFHHDHIGGMRAAIAEGITIIAGEHAAGEIRRAALAHQRLMPDSQSRAPREPRIEVLRGSRTLSGGGRTLQLLDIGPNPHAEQMIVAYVPGARVLYEADMLDLSIPEGGTPPAGHDTRGLVAAMTRHGLDVGTIVPSHGRIGTLEDLRRATAGGAAP